MSKNKTVPVMTLSDFDVNEVDWTAKGYTWMPMPDLTVVDDDNPLFEPSERDKAIAFLRSLPEDMPVMVLTPRSRLEMGAAENLVTDFDHQREGHYNPFGAAYQRMMDWTYNQDDLPDYPNED